METTQPFSGKVDHKGREVYYTDITYDNRFKNEIMDHNRKQTELMEEHMSAQTKLLKDILKVLKEAKGNERTDV